MKTLTNISVLLAMVIGVGATMAMSVGAAGAHEAPTVTTRTEHWRNKVDNSKSLVHTVVVEAPAAEVWRAWSTVEGAQTFFAPKVEIELRSGGDFNILFLPDEPEGRRGAEGQRVLSYIPGRMISFDWGVPPKFPELRQAFLESTENRPFVVVEIAVAGESRTLVTLTHLGFGKGSEWHGVWAYFDEAWPYVLGNLKERFETGPIDWVALRAQQKSQSED